MADTPQEAGTLQTAAPYEGPVVAVAGARADVTACIHAGVRPCALACAGTFGRIIGRIFGCPAGRTVGRAVGLVVGLIAGRAVDFTVGVIFGASAALVTTASRANENRPIALTIGLPGKLVAGTGFEPVTFGL